MYRGYLLIIAALFSLTSNLWAQQTYNMANQTIYECDGILLDSDAGIGGDYGHNENLTFTICVPQATQINLAFSAFCTEAVLDYIMVYDGPNTGSPLLGGPYSGLPYLRT